MSFITLTITCDEEKREFLIAELSLFPFDAFEETETGLLASCEKDDYEPEEVKEVLDRYKVEYQ
ncbi:MAG TPA: 50S ribosomal protein L11 methyltransferase, partial [Cytophagales bacterium]|nr:50S ribosomal protein L11 methyltransferase [Cytophagales bacterium]